MREDKSLFNPCKLGELIYLCGCDSKLVEVFSPLTDLFLTHTLVLLDGPSHCCLYVHNNFLVVHSYQHISKVAVESSGQLVKHSQIKSETPTNKASNSQPVLDSARNLFFLYQQDKCICFHMETGLEVQSFT